MQFQSTLPRGERRMLLSVRLQLLHFNPRSREGSDAVYQAAGDAQETFQSTLPRGERRGM